MFELACFVFACVDFVPWEDAVSHPPTPSSSHGKQELKTAHDVRGERAREQFCLCNIRRRGRDADVKRESERKEEKFGLLLLSSYLYAEDNTVTNQNPGSWHSNSHTSPSLRASCLTIQAPAVMNSWRKQQEHLLTWCTFPNVPQSVNLNIYTQHSLRATAAQSLYAKLVKCLINMHHKAHEGSVKLGMWSCVSHCLVCSAFGSNDKPSSQNSSGWCFQYAVQSNWFTTCGKDLSGDKQWAAGEYMCAA